MVTSFRLESSLWGEPVSNNYQVLWKNQFD